MFKASHYVVYKRDVCQASEIREKYEDNIKIIKTTYLRNKQHLDNNKRIS